MIKTKKKNLLLTVGSILAGLLLVFGLVLIGTNIKTKSSVANTNVVFADPVMATTGYCGDTSVNDGKNVQWEISNHVLRIWCPNGSAAMGDCNEVLGDQYFWYESSEKITMSDFYNDFKNSINSVVVENGVTKIGNTAFRQFELTSISLPNTITEIRENAFMECTISSVTIPDSVTTLGNTVFQHSTINEIHLGKNVRQFGQTVFFPINEGVGGFYEGGTNTVDIYLKVKYSDFVNGSAVTTYLSDFAASLFYPNEQPGGGVKSDFEYVINGTDGEYVDYNTAYDWSNGQTQKANIHYDSSLNEYFADVFANADSNTITIMQNTVPQTGIAYNLSITISTIVLLGALLVVMTKKKNNNIA